MPGAGCMVLMTFLKVLLVLRLLTVMICHRCVDNVLCEQVWPSVLLFCFFCFPIIVVCDLYQLLLHVYFPSLHCFVSFNLLVKFVLWCCECFKLYCLFLFCFLNIFVFYQLSSLFCLLCPIIVRIVYLMRYSGWSCVWGYAFWLCRSRSTSTSGNHSADPLI